MRQLVFNCAATIFKTFGTSSNCTPTLDQEILGQVICHCFGDTGLYNFLLTVSVGANVIKLLMAIIYEFLVQAKVFVTASLSSLVCSLCARPGDSL
jgi:hypothetical protein